MTFRGEYLYGYHPVMESLRANRRKIYRVYVGNAKSGRRAGSIARLANRMGLSVSEVPTSKLKEMTRSAGHQGVAAAVGPYPLVPLENLLASGGNNHPDTVLLLLDCIEDTQNLGALLRTALCANVDGIVMTKKRAAPPLPSVSKASAGALEHSRIARVTNLVSAIKIMKDNHFWIAGMDISASVDLFHSEFGGKIGIVIGGEEKGMRPLVKKQCDYLVKIPMAGPVASLNASAAGAVAVYEVFRQRGMAKKYK